MPSVTPSARRRLGAAAALLATLALVGCDSQHTTGPGSLDPPLFANNITIPDLGTILGAGPARVAIRLEPGTLIAKRVLVKQAAQLSRPERIDSRVTALVTTATEDTLTLALGDLKVVVNGNTQFRGEHEDGDREDVAASGDLDAPASLADFTARIQAMLAAGRQPAVEAMRTPPASPQAPDKADFVASVLRMDAAADHPGIEMNVAAANLISNASPPPDAWLEVLDRKIELRLSDGTTRISQETPRTEGELQFEGKVKSVDLTAKTATLDDGAVLRIVAGSEIESGDGRDDPTLPSLADVQTALAAHDSVIAKGEGLLETPTPRTIDVISVRFRIKEAEEQEPHIVAFTDTLAAADSVARTFTLGNGTLVKVTATRISPRSAVC